MTKYLTLTLLFVSMAQAATFKFRLLADPTTLDWHQASTSVETPLMMNLMEGLMEVDSNLKPKPCLAEKMELSSDQKTYTFTLRKGVKWSDGTPLKAQDFVEGFKRLLDPATAAPYAYLLYDVVGAEDFNKKKMVDFAQVGLKTKGDQQLQIILKKPVAYFPYLTGFWPLFPVRKDLIDLHGASWTRPGKLVTVGAYQLDSLQNSSKVVLKANPHYWRKIGNVTEAMAMIIKDSATALNVFKSGGIQVMQDFSPDDLKLARPMPEFKTFPYLKTHYLAFKTKGAETENVNLRLALAHAIDRRPIPSILNGSQKLATTFVPPKVVGHDPKMQMAFDPIKAKEFLKKSGYSNGRPLEIVARNSERPRILAQYIQSELKKNLGIQAQIQLFDHKVFRSQITTNGFPMMMMVWAADYPDGDSFLGLFESNTGNNITQYSNKLFDENMTRAREDWNTLKRDKLYKEAQAQLQLKDAVVLPLFYEENEALVAKSVKGFTINPIGYFFLKDIKVQQ
jgi:oligopeptide transport system substrate-binding protein